MSNSSHIKIPAAFRYLQNGTDSNGNNNTASTPTPSLPSNSTIYPFISKSSSDLLLSPAPNSHQAASSASPEAEFVFTSATATDEPAPRYQSSQTNRQNLSPPNLSPNINSAPPIVARSTSLHKARSTPALSQQRAVSSASYTSGGSQQTNSQYSSPNANPLLFPTFLEASNPPVPFASPSQPNRSSHRSLAHLKLSQDNRYSNASSATTTTSQSDRSSTSSSAFISPTSQCLPSSSCASPSSSTLPKFFDSRPPTQPQTPSTAYPPVNTTLAAIPPKPAYSHNSSGSGSTTDGAECAYDPSLSESCTSKDLADDIISAYTDESPLSKTTNSISKMTTPLSTTPSSSTSQLATTQPAPPKPLVSTSFPTSTNPTTIPRSNTDASRDRYGFKKKTAYITEQQYDEWWKGYHQHIERRKKKWLALMKDNGLSVEHDQPLRFPPRSEKLKRYIRKGIPAEWRGNAWFFYAKGSEKLNANKGVYDKLCAQTTTLKNTDTDIIERDLFRTFPDNIHFRMDQQSPQPPQQSSESLEEELKEPVLITALRRLLVSFSVYQPKIGYCQSLNFLAGLLLLFMDEEKAFWMLVIITQRYLPGVHEVNLEGVNVDQGVLMLCTREALPKLWAKIGVNFDGAHDPNMLSKLPPITLCTAAWFMSGYIGIFPIETVLRVWDCFFFEDSKTFFRVALTVFKLAESELENLHDPMEVFQVVQSFPKKILDPSLLLGTCFKRRNGIGHISQDEIKKMREFVRAKRQQASLAALKQQQEQFMPIQPQPQAAQPVESSTKRQTDSNGSSTSTADPLSEAADPNQPDSPQPSSSSASQQSSPQDTSKPRPRLQHSASAFIKRGPKSKKARSSTNLSDSPTKRVSTGLAFGNSSSAGNSQSSQAADANAPPSNDLEEYLQYKHPHGRYANFTKRMKSLKIASTGLPQT